MNQGDTVQIETPDFNPDIGRDSPLSTDEKPNEVTIQGYYHLFLKLLSQRMIIVLPLEQLHNNQLPKKPIGLILSPD